ncbi:MAG: SurA N-terminal domain-containing protein [Pyrinomonadaceae bacterium]|nr:SurA N-terminal domain-containing protein [Pyrinomonadaceae bacterium]
MVATVNGGVRPDLITYSDLIWQLALQPDTPLSNPSQQDLNGALQLIISQQLILQEAEKLPTITPTDREVEAELATLIKQFPSQTEFQQRVTRVGLSAEQLREIVRRRVAIKKYLDFRFRSFTVITTREVESYYTDIYVPRLRRQMPGVIVPLLDDQVREPDGTVRTVRARIESILIESKIESDTDAFLDEARERAEIVYLTPEFR